MNKRQALGIDIDRYARTGGTNFELATKHIQDGIYDFLIIQAGIGTWKSPVFDEQRELASKAGIPFVTYHLLDPDSPNTEAPKENMVQQAKKYIDWVGKNQPVYIADIELPKTDGSGRLPTKKELQLYLAEIKRLTGKQPILYTRLNILEAISFTIEAAHYDLWIADFPWVKSLYPKSKELYRYFQDFLKDYAWTLPPSVNNTNLKKKVLLWQFSKKGDGTHYIYNNKLPNNKDGKKSADLNVSIKERDEFMKLMFGKIPDLPKPALQTQELTTEQLEKLAQSGITPDILVDISMDDLEIEEFKALHEKLAKAGISPKVQINLRTSIRP